jgi:biotin carboxyl carrier protein
VIWEIELDGTRHRVAVRRSGDGWLAEIDDREVQVSVVERDGQWVLLAGETVARKSYAIAFEPAADAGLIVHVNGVAVPLTVLDQRNRRRRRGADGGSDAQPRMIVAPMPGRIVKVLVKPDETVAARQPLVVVEAMKMENELRAPRAGVVADVRVAEGASVEANTVLMVLT